MEDIDLERRFECENGFYLTVSVGRLSKFATHLDLFRKILDLPGEIVECGVFKGVSLSRLIRFRVLFGGPFSRRIIAFDTFGPFPEAGYEGDDLIRDRFIAEAGDTSITTDRLTELLAANGLNENLQLIEGDLLETAPAYLAENPHLKIALLNVDVDLHEPTKAVLEHFYPRVVRGGIVTLDDYGAFPGANAAIDAYFEPIGVKVQKLPYTSAISYVQKP